MKVTPAPRPRRPVAALRLSGRNARLCAPQRFIGRSPQVETRLLLFLSLLNDPQTGSTTPKRPAVRAIRERPGHAPAQKAPRRGLGLYWRESIAHHGLRGASPLRRSECARLRPRWHTRCARKVRPTMRGPMVDLDSIPPIGHQPSHTVDCLHLQCTHQPQQPNPGLDHRGL